MFLGFEKNDIAVWSYRIFKPVKSVMNLQKFLQKVIGDIEVR